MANLVTLQGEDQPFIRNVMTLKSCSPIVGVDVMSFDTEREVLLAWRVSFLSLHSPSFTVLNLLRVSFCDKNLVWLKAMLCNYCFCLTELT